MPGRPFPLAWAYGWLVYPHEHSQMLGLLLLHALRCAEQRGWSSTVRSVFCSCATWFLARLLSAALFARLTRTDPIVTRCYASRRSLAPAALSSCCDAFAQPSPPLLRVLARLGAPARARCGCREHRQRVQRGPEQPSSQIRGGAVRVSARASCSGPVQPGTADLPCRREERCQGFTADVDRTRSYNDCGKYKDSPSSKCQTRACCHSRLRRSSAKASVETRWRMTRQGSDR